MAAGFFAAALAAADFTAGLATGFLAAALAAAGFAAGLAVYLFAVVATAAGFTKLKREDWPESDTFDFFCAPDSDAF
ncbi:hypothetical protein C1Y31_28195 [Pseudomonas sp. FW305-25]|nr:hypothetical protein C1Y31_28195 [Pseudomonas sp. FW305-25]PMY60742.1 hypothetical protein C1Y32_31005 [Pseudomonas sp. FW126-L8]PNA73524.1 hypothetical protein C1Y33_27035 [Pseudomonas sp. FW305-76]